MENILCIGMAVTDRMTLLWGEAGNQNRRKAGNHFKSATRIVRRN
jgi:hypothetical protein